VLIISAMPTNGTLLKLHDTIGYHSDRSMAFLLVSVTAEDDVVADAFWQYANICADAALQANYMLKACSDLLTMSGRQACA